MEPGILKFFFLSALSFTGILCGASLDQSIKQLPARHATGMKAFSTYAKSADLKNGVIWYAIIGIGAALTSIITAILAWKHHSREAYDLPIYLGAIFAILHSICTSMAAPIYHKQKRIHDEEALSMLFNRFERIQTIRSIFCLLNFFAFIWALAIMV